MQYSLGTTGLYKSQLETHRRMNRRMTSDDWDRLKSRGKSLDSQISKKLEDYSAFGRTVRDSLENPSRDSRNGQRISDGNESSEHILETLITQDKTYSLEIREFLERLSKLLDQMGSIVENEKGSVSKRQIVQRYRSVLQEHQNLFKNLSSNISSYLQRMELLSGGRRRYDSEGADRSTDLLLREQSSLNYSVKASDEVIGQAHSTLEEMKKMRSAFSSSKNKAIQLVSGSPIINSLINRIKRTKQRDTIVLAITIAVCMIFTFIYWLDK